LESVQSFQLVPDDPERATSRLVSTDGSAIATVEGTTIEAQFRCARGYLVITSDAHPYEEMLHFHLLDEGMKVIDTVSLGRIYHSGILRELMVGAGDEVEFSFFGEERWRLVILKKPTRVRPKLFSSITYPAGALKRHFLRLEKVTA
jgi:hypothetical protein